MKEWKTSDTLKALFPRSQVKKYWGVKKAMHRRRLPFMGNKSVNCPGNVKKREKGTAVDIERECDGEIL